MGKRSLIFTTILGVTLSVFFLSMVFVSAGQQVPDVITMKSSLFKKHKKGLVTFTHKKHTKDYKIACAECHHVYEGGKNVWKEGYTVKECMECHNKPGKPKAKKGEKLSQAEKIKYLYTAIHTNCKGCHKKLKKEGKKTGPTKCTGCHPKKK